MKHVTIPITSTNGAKKLTPDQRNLLIILEDVSLRFAGAETFALSQLNEMKNSGLARSYCADVQAAFARLFDAVCTNTLEFFTEKQTEN